MAKKVKVTNPKLRKLITDEKNASKEYHKYGFNELASDEKSHERYLKKVLATRKDP